MRTQLLETAAPALSGNVTIHALLSYLKCYLRSQYMGWGGMEYFSADYQVVLVEKMSHL